MKANPLKYVRNQYDQKVLLRAKYNARVLGHQHAGVEQVAMEVVQNHDESA
jgi:hypothetical protein